MTHFTLFQKLALASAVTLFLSACNLSLGGNSSGEGGGNNPQKASYVNWEAIPSDFNPSIDTVKFRTDGAEKILVNAFGFDQDVNVTYSPDVHQNEGSLRVFKVWKKSASWGDLKANSNGKKLNLTGYGSYQCSIKIQNGEITDLEGGCYVRLQIVLPVGAQIEVYNVGQLLTQRFIPIDNETFLEQFAHATWADDKFVVIENFLTSYDGMSKKPSLTSHELGTVVHAFMEGNDKFKALRRLHPLVSDRENLNSMIESEFNYFDRQEAHKIVGL